MKTKKARPFCLGNLLSQSLAALSLSPFLSRCLSLFPPTPSLTLIKKITIEFYCFERIGHNKNTTERTPKKLRSSRSASFLFLSLSRFPSSSSSFLLKTSTTTNQPFTISTTTSSPSSSSGQRRELEDLGHDLQARRHLPREQRQVDAVERDVQRPRRVAALLHLRDQGRRGSPEHDDDRPRVEVRAGEELARAQVGVGGSLDGDEDAQRQQQRAPVEVLVPGPRGDQGLALGLELGDLPVERGGRARRRGGCALRSRCSFRQLRLEGLDEVGDLAGAAPPEAEPSRVARRAEEEEHDRRVEQGDELAREEVIVPSGPGGEGREGRRERGEGREGDGEAVFVCWVFFFFVVLCPERSEKHGF